MQQRQIFQHGGIALRLQLHRYRRQQGLGHQGLGVGLQGVEPQPLVGGMLVDEPHGVLVILADDIGFQHLAHHAPRCFPHRLHGLLHRFHRHIQRLLNGRFSPRCFRLGPGRRCLFRRGDLIGAARQGRCRDEGLILRGHIPDIDGLSAVRPLRHCRDTVPDEVFRGRSGRPGREAPQRFFLLRRRGCSGLELLRRHFPEKFRFITGLLGGLFGV